MTDLLEIPEFLDRCKWTAEQHAAAAAAWDRVQRRASDEAARQRRQRDRAIVAAKAEREAKAQAKAKRRQDREDRKARNAQRRADRAAVVQMIERKHTTIGQMQKASGIPADRLKPTIRWLLRHDRISKATPRTYTL